jgi:hypothetical protein
VRSLGWTEGAASPDLVTIPANDDNQPKPEAPPAPLKFERTYLCPFPVRARFVALTYRPTPLAHSSSQS